MKYDNYTKYGIHDKAERYVLSGYMFLIVLSSVIGDTLILIGSIRYNAIKLHKIMVVFIQYIAVADLVCSIFRVLPGAVSLVANGWIFGDFLCSATFIMMFIFAGTGFLLISALTFSKFMIIKYPFRAVHFSKKHGHLATLGMFAFWCCFGVIYIVDGTSAYFSYLGYNSSLYPSLNSKVYYIACVVVGAICLISITITIVNSAMLLYLAKKVADRGTRGLQWQGVRTVLLTVAAYAISNVPLAVYFIVLPGSQPQTAASFYYKFQRFAGFIVDLNIVSNFYIYTISLTSFREFLKSRIRVVADYIVRCFVPNGDQPTAHRGTERQRLLT